jgi:hypothetical protein
VARRLPLEDPDFITYLRIGYVASQLISLAIYWFITLKVSERLYRSCLRLGSERWC